MQSGLETSQRLAGNGAAALGAPTSTSLRGAALAQAARDRRKRSTPDTGSRDAMTEARPVHHTSTQNVAERCYDGLDERLRPRSPTTPRDALMPQISSSQ